MSEATDRWLYVPTMDTKTGWSAYRVKSDREERPAGFRQSRTGALPTELPRSLSRRTVTPEAGIEPATSGPASHGERALSGRDHRVVRSARPAEQADDITGSRP